MVVYQYEATTKRYKNENNDKMNKQKQRETPEIIVPKGYDLLDLIDTDDSGCGFKDKAVNPA